VFKKFVSVLGLSVILQAQPAATTASDLNFEVASLKSTLPGETGPIIRRIPGGLRYSTVGTTLKLMIETAFGLRADQIAGGPDWIDRDRFNLEAKAERPSSTDELHMMLKTLLLDRFGLTFRMESKESSVYVLTELASGNKLTAHESRNGGDSSVKYLAEQPLHLKLTATAVSLDYFTWYLRSFLEKPIVNHTGVKGTYDFTLSYTMEPPPSMHDGTMGHAGKPIDFSGPTIFQAFRDQLGLRLVSGRAPMQLLVITHAEKPTPN